MSNVQIEVSGEDAEQFLERIVVSDLQALKIGKGIIMCMSGSK